jgi:Tfp pilus assembly protein PilN
MTWSHKKINVLRAAGVASVLGIDCTDTRARVVELALHGGLLNKFRTTFTVNNFFTIEFEPSDNNEARSDRLSKAIQGHGIKTRYVSTSIQTHGVRSVIADISSSGTNILGWIHDNYEKLLHLQAPINDIAIGYEILSARDGMRSVEVTFVRKTDLEQSEAILALSGLIPLSITAGIRDALNPLLYDREFLEQQKFSFVYFGQHDAVVFEFDKQKRVETSRSDKNAIDMNTNSTVWVGGEIGEHHEREFRPLSIPTEYMLAVGCAIKGCLSDVHPMDFTATATKTIMQGSVHKRIFTRTVIACGIMIAGFLCAEIAGSLIIETLLENGESAYRQSGLNYSELTTLEKQNADLKDELKKKGSLLYRSNTAEVYHDIAARTPSDVWLQKIHVDGKIKPTGIITIAGYAASGDDVAGLLKNLGSSQILRDVHLVKSRVPTENDNIGVIRTRLPHPMMFELQAGIRR